MLKTLTHFSASHGGCFLCPLIIVEVQIQFSKDDAKLNSANVKFISEISKLSYKRVVKYYKCFTFYKHFVWYLHMTDFKFLIKPKISIINNVA